MRFIFYLYIFILVNLKCVALTYTAIGCPGPVLWGGFTAGTCPFWNGGTQLIAQPAAGSILVIPAGCTVTINANITVSNSITINIYGQLKFNTSSDKLNLAAGSVINIYAGGSISGPSGSNQIGIGTGPSEWSGPGTNPGPFTISDGNSTLPIELIEFTGTCIVNGVQLNWSTATETNNEYFLVEKSLNGAEWLYDAKVLGNGTTGAAQHYIHTDYEVNSGELIYYRLSQVDKDQTKTVFKAIDINCGNNLPNQMMTFSNPSSTELNIYFSVNEVAVNSSIKLINNVGQIVMDTKLDLIKGLNSFVFPIDINPGTYLMIFSSDNLSLPSQKLLIVN